MRSFASLCLALLVFVLPLQSTFAAAVAPPPGTAVVKPGDTLSNGDVKVANDSAMPRAAGALGGATARVTPRNGNEESSSGVTTESGFKGKVSGVESNDTLVLGPRNKVDVEGTGGSVSVGNNSSVTVKNTAPVGGASIQVTLPTGATVSIGPGSTCTVST